uniref:Uncharacterized protein n=1 Tax=Romanomermis culicivorax TaxID=13658 RepID=A0A915KSS2_ROMCU
MITDKHRSAIMRDPCSGWSHSKCLKLPKSVTDFYANTVERESKKHIAVLFGLPNSDGDLEPDNTEKLIFFD